MAADQLGRQRMPGQFVLGDAGIACPDDWVDSSGDGWTLRRCPTLPMVTIVDASGTASGWILGHPICDGSMLTIAFQVDAKRADGGFLSAASTALEALTGRYAAIVTTSTGGRVMLDASGQMAVVYNADSRSVASSWRLIGHQEGVDKAVVDAFGIPREDHFLPFGLTPNPAVSRLLPDHHLDLATFAPQRDWPLVAITESSSSIEAVVEAIARRLVANISAIAERMPMAIWLTAGRDSRMVLAAARAHLAETRFFTLAVPDAAAAMDARVAKRLSANYGFRHDVLRWIPPSQADLDEWQVRVGDCVAGRSWQTVRTAHQIDPSLASVSGLAGEVTRCTRATADDLEHEDEQLTPVDVLGRLRLPQAKVAVESAEQWLAGLSHLSRVHVLDLLFIEQRLGCWAGPSHYGHTNNPTMIPMSDRTLFRLMMSLPPGYRISAQLPTALIERLWPELLDVPFNEDVGLDRAVAGLDRAMTGVRRRLRRLTR